MRVTQDVIRGYDDALREEEEEGKKAQRPGVTKQPTPLPHSWGSTQVWHNAEPEGVLVSAG